MGPHPGTSAITEMEIGGLKGFVDWIAQGQHYGIPTEYLDVTRSREIAEFLARKKPFHTPMSGLARCWNSLMMAHSYFPRMECQKSPIQS